MGDVHVLCDGEIAEDDLVWTDADDRAISGEKGVDGFTLLEPERMGEKPEVGYGSIPRTWYGAEGRKSKLVYRVEQEVKWGEENKRDEKIVDEGPKV